MKQIVSNYTYSPTANCVTLAGLNIDQDQLLLVVAPQVGRTLYNFASVTGTVIAGTDTRINLTASTAGLTTTSPLVIFYDDQLSAQSVTGTVALDPASLIALENVTVTVGSSVSISNFPSTQTIAGTVTASIAGSNFDDDGNLFVSLQPGPVPYTQPISGTVTARGNLIGIGQEGTGFLLLALDDAGIQNPVLANGDGHLLVSVQSGTVTANLSSANLNSVTIGVRGTVTVGNSVTIGSLPPISGTVTANVPNLVFESNSPGFYGVPIMGLNNSDTYQTITLDEDGRVYVNAAGTVTVGNSVTIGSCVTHGVRLQDASGNNLTSTSIGGVQRLNVSLASAATPGGSLPSFVNVYGGSDTGTVRAVAVDSSGRTVVTGTISSRLEGWDIATHDYRAFGYSSGNLSTITYKSGGASGTTVGILTLAYDGSGNLTSMTRT